MVGNGQGRSAVWSAHEELRDVPARVDSSLTEHVSPLVGTGPEKWQKWPDSPLMKPKAQSGPSDYMSRKRQKAKVKPDEGLWWAGSSVRRRPGGLSLLGSRVPKIAGSELREREAAENLVVKS